VLIGGIGSTAAIARAARQGTAAPDDAGPASSRALIPVAAPAPSERSTTASRRPLAPFLAHLIATQAQAPQTRVRRRAEPEEASEAYGAALSGRGRSRGKLDCRA
jgi:hypothetical protein